MPNIYNYLDFRKFLKAYYKEQKAKNPAFSYQFFAMRAGFKSKSLIHHIMEGKRNLSKEAVFKIGGALKLTDKAFSYFQDLVAFNQAQTVKERNFYFRKLSEYNKRNAAKTVLRNQYEFYSKWYYNTIRELLGFVEFKEDFAKLGKMVKPALSPQETKRAVKLLVKLGLVHKTTKGYEPVDRSITTGDEVRALAVQNFHRQNLNLAAESIETCTGDERDISTLIVSVSQETFGKIKSEIQAFRKKLMQIADSTQKPERVYHINFQFYPTSEKNRGFARPNKND